MFTLKRSILWGAVATSVTLTGCATTWGGPGFRIGVAPTNGFGLTASNCSLLGTPIHSPLQGMASGAWIANLPQRVQSLQQRFSLASAPPGVPNQSWKQAATGAC